MWLKHLLGRFSERRRTGPSDFEMMKEALKPTQTRPMPPKPSSARPRIGKRSS
jgi:hypothetical protein